MRSGGGQGLIALASALAAVILVSAAAREARQAAMLDVPCLGSMWHAAGLAVTGFASALVAVRTALASTRITDRGVIVDGVVRTHRIALDDVVAFAATFQDPGRDRRPTVAALTRGPRIDLSPLPFLGAARLRDRTLEDVRPRVAALTDALEQARAASAHDAAAARPVAPRSPALRRWAVLTPALGALCLTPVAAAALGTYEAPRPVALRGFAGGPGPTPQTGTWTATGTYRVSEGLGRRDEGDRIERTLVIRRFCGAGRCGLMLTRSFAEGPPLTATLTAHADGWHARFPPLRFACSKGAGSASAPMRARWVLHFRDGGRTLDARERIFVFERGCQYRNSLVEWSASLDAPDAAPAPPRPARPDDRV